MKRTFVIGDIHGCSKTFKKLLFDIIDITREDEIYLLGDYIDRGPRSKQVIRRIIKLKKEGYMIYPVMGNHELLLLDSYSFVQNQIAWFRNGGKATLDSFGIKYAYEFKSKYIKFFQSLPYYYELEKFIIVHGGLNFSIPNPLDDKDAMLWIRQDKVDLNKTNGKKLICGHTPSTLDIIKSSLKKDKILLDGGCVYYGLHAGHGYLVALEINSMELFFQRNIDFW